MKERRDDFDRRSKLVALVMALVLVSIIVIGVLDVCGVFDEPEESMWRPTAIYPMTNANISWQQTYYGPKGDGWK